MSSVRMSGVIRDNIIRRGENLFKKSMIILESNLSEDFHDRVASEFIQHEFTPYIDSVPEQWKVRVNQVTHSINYQVAHGGGLTEMSFDKMMLLKKPQIIKIADLYDEGYGSSKTLIIPNSFHSSMALCEELAIWRAEITDAQREEQVFMDELKNILKRCNTIKQFLDTWPQGENLTPPDILARLNEKPVREKPDPILTEEASVTLSQTLLKRTLMS